MTTYHRQSCGSRRHGPVRIARRVVTVAGLALLTATLFPVPAAAQDGRWWRDTWRMDEVLELADGSGVTVAVIDGGVDGSVPELAGAVLPGTDLSGQGTDGTADLADGHGTRMASLIAARGGDRGVQGVAPGAAILSIVGSSDAEDGLVVGDDGEWVADAIRYAVDHGAQVVNISLAFPTRNDADRYPCPPVLDHAIRHAVSQDAIVVAGSGNDAERDPMAPASCPGTLSVGALDSRLAPWRDSLRGPHVDVAAPGVELLTVSVDSELRLSTGTSASTALVSGVAALVRQQFPEASAREVATRLIGTATDVGSPGWDEATGFGMVDPLAALTADVPADTPNPSYDALDELPPAGPTGPPRPSPPQIPPPAAERGSGGFGIPLPVVLGVPATLVLTAGMAGLLMVTRRPRHPSPPPGHNPPVPPGTGPPYQAYPAPPPPGPAPPPGHGPPPPGHRPPVTPPPPR